MSKGSSSPSHNSIETNKPNAVLGQIWETLQCRFTTLSHLLTYRSPKLSASSSRLCRSSSASSVECRLWAVSIATPTKQWELKRPSRSSWRSSYRYVLVPLPPPRIQLKRVRTGGQVCIKCQGTGHVVSLWMFDEDVCSRCRGSGRVFF